MEFPTPTGYADQLGNIWVFSDGHTVIDGKTVRGSLRPGQRRMLEPGSLYYDTRGELRRVPEWEAS